MIPPRLHNFTKMPQSPGESMQGESPLWNLPLAAKTSASVHSTVPIGFWKEFETRQFRLSSLDQMNQISYSPHQEPNLSMSTKPISYWTCFSNKFKSCTYLIPRVPGILLPVIDGESQLLKRKTIFKSWRSKYLIDYNIW